MRFSLRLLFLFIILFHFPDTEYLYTKAFKHITNRYNKEFTWEHKAHLMGCKTKDIANYLIKELELPLTVEEFKQEITEIYRELFPHTNPMPGNILFKNEIRLISNR